MALALPLLLAAAWAAAAAAASVATAGVVYGASATRGSLAGGTELQIFGAGFAPMDGNSVVQIWLGASQCRVELYFSTDKMITCYTPPAPLDSRGFFTATTVSIRATMVTTNGVSTTLASPPLSFAYASASTPTHAWGYGGGAAGKNFSVWGDLRNPLYGEYTVSMAGSICATPGMYASNTTILSGSTWAAFRCVLGDIMPGRTNVTLSVADTNNSNAKGYGSAWRSRRSYQVDASGVLHQFTAHPIITGLSSATSGLGGGASLVISGSGFAGVAAGNRVFLGGGASDGGGANGSGTALGSLDAAQSECIVTSASLTQLTCTLPPRAAASRASAADRPAGRGLLHRVWLGSSMTLATPASGRTPDIAKTSTGVLVGHWLDEGVNDYVQQLSGFFVPPVSAFYSFSIASDDASTLAISTNASSKFARTVASLDSYSADFFTASTQISVPLWFAAGTPYYFATTHRQTYGGDSLHVAMRVHASLVRDSVTGAAVPGANAAVAALQSSTQLAFASVAPVLRIRMTLSNVRAVQQISIAGAGAGTMYVAWAGGSGFTSVAADASAAAIKTALKNYACGSVAVVRAAFNTSAGVPGVLWNVTIDCSLASGSSWPTISLQANSLTPLAQYEIALASSSLVAASAPLGGSIAFTYGGVTSAFISAQSWDDLLAALLTLPGIGSADMVNGQTWKGNDGAQWTVRLDNGPYGNMSELGIITTALTGSGVVASVVMAQAASPDPYYWPVPLDYFRTPLAGAEPITVVSNGILSDCDVWRAGSPCSFAYSSALTPTITAAATAEGAPPAAGIVLRINGTGFAPAALGAAADLHAVLFNGSASGCNVTAATNTSLTCTLAAAPAGAYDVSVLVSAGGAGISLPATGKALPTLVYALAITSLAPAQGSLLGGTVIVITGSGFGSTPERDVVLVGGAPCAVRSADISSVTCVTPPSAAYLADSSVAVVSVAVTVNGGGDASFRYDIASTPAVVSMSPTRLPAGISGVLTLQLTGIPSGANATVVLGARACTVTSMAWAGAAGAASLNCTLLRGFARALPQAPLAPVVNLAGAGIAIATGVLFDDSFAVTSIEPAEGSLAGGTLITLAGTGFNAAALDANEVDFVFRDIGYGYEWSVACPVLSVSANGTALTCRAPPIPGVKRGDPRLWNASSSLAGALRVKVNNVTAPCAAATADCAFAQTPAHTANIATATLLNDTAAPSRYSLRLNGSALSSAAGGLRVLVGGLPCAVTAVQADALWCQLPIGPAGPATLSATAAATGDAANVSAAAAAAVIFPFWVAPFATAPAGSTAGGMLVTFTGAGFPSAPGAANVTFGNVAGEVVSGNASTLVVRVPPHVSTFSHVWTSSVPTCPVGTAWPLDFSGKQCFDLARVFTSAYDAQTCMDTCCASDACQLYQWCPSGAACSSPNECWIGAISSCSNSSSTAGWISRGRDASIVDVGISSSKLVAPVRLFQAMNYSAALTATLATVSPLTGVPGMTLTLRGSRFAAAAATTVAVGGIACVLAASACNATHLICTLGASPAGAHRVIVMDGRGMAASASLAAVTVTLAASIAGITPSVLGYGGGQLVTVSGAGFASVGVGSNLITVCNTPCTVITASYSALTCRSSALTTPAALSAFPVNDAATLVASAASPAAAAAAVDGDITTLFTSCAVTSDLGASTRAIVTGARAYPAFRKTAAMVGGVFAGSLDNASWVTLGTLGAYVGEGWNNIQVISVPGIAMLSTTALTPATVPNITASALGAQPLYRYLRFTFAPAVTGAACTGAEIAFTGFAVAAVAAGEVCAVNVTVAPAASAAAPAMAGVAAATTVASPAAVAFSAALTPLVTSLSPNNGSALGGDVVTLRGSGFSAASTVVLNGMPCAVLAAAPSVITCVTSPRTAIAPLSVAVASASGEVSTALYDASDVYFRYLDRWSHLTTWKYQEPPTEGNSVSVPLGQAILVDISPPQLFLVAVEGELVFDDAADLTFDASYIVAYGGQISAGSEAHPHTHRLTITLHGDRATSIEIPNFGAKCLVIADAGMSPAAMAAKAAASANTTASNATVDYATAWYAPNQPTTRAYSRASLDLHGLPRMRVWTMLASDAAAGSTRLSLTEPVDWAAGETLFVTHYSDDALSELVTVAGLAPGDARTVLLAAPLRNAHRSRMVSGAAWGIADVDERSEVGLLSRNIVVQGDDSSAAQLYGSHMAAMGGGLFRIENIELRRCGQAGALGRYCSHFHMLGDAPDSYVRHNSIHDAYQRAITVHGTNYASVLGNAAYNILGHSIFVEDGVERWNAIEANLVAGTKPCFMCTVGDADPGNFWAASPTNIWRHNRAAGSTRMGFGFELPGRPLGPSADTPNYNPFIMPLVEFFNNTAHSHKVGLKIYPGYGPLVSQYFVNTTFANNGLGVFHQGVSATMHQLGSVFTGNGRGIVWQDVDRLLPEGNIINSTFICSSSGSACGGSGIIGPQTENFVVAGATFINYGASGSPLSGCYLCEDNQFYDQGTHMYNVSRLVFINSPRRVTWSPPYKDFFADSDGSLTGKVGGWAIAPHAFNSWPECPLDTVGTFSGGNVCDGSVAVRKLQLDWVAPDSLAWKNLVVNSSAGTASVLFRPRGQYGWTWPAVTKHWYAHSWSPGPAADWQRLRVSWSDAAKIEEGPADDWLGMNWSWTTARYRNKVTYGGKPQIDGSIWGGQERADLPQFSLPSPGSPIGTGQLPDSSNRWSAILTRNQANETDASVRYSFSAVAVQCAPGQCVAPTPAPQSVYSGAGKLWSDPATWPSGRVPAAGESFNISANSSVVLDIEPPTLGTMTIFGKLAFLDTAPRRLVAAAIAVWGVLEVGTAAAPFQNTAEIVLYGTTLAPAPLILSNNLFLGNKVLAVLGRLTMVGRARAPVWTRLNATAPAGATSILLAALVNGTSGVNSSVAGWRVGDTIALSSTGFAWTTYETATIAGIAGAVVTLAAPLAYTHFAGAAAPSGVGAGVLLQTAVGLLTRNVVLRGNTTSALDAYGAAVFVGAVVPGDGTGATSSRYGAVDLRYVQLSRMGRQTGIALPALTLQYGKFLFSPGSPALGATPVSVLEGVAFEACHAAAVVAIAAPSLVLNGSVVHRTYGDAVSLDSASQNASVTGNLLIGNEMPSAANAPGTTQWHQPQSAILVNTWAAALSGNLVSGAVDAAFSYRVPACSAPAAPYAGNEAHGVRLGVILLPTVTARSCIRLDGFRVWKAAHIGIFSMDQHSTLRIDDVLAADCHVGVSINYQGGLGVATTTPSVGTLSNSVILGSTAASPSCDADTLCRAVDSADLSGVGCGSVLGATYRRAGILLPMYNGFMKTCGENGEISPCTQPSRVTRKCLLPLETRGGTIGKINTQLRISNVTFGYFAVDDCGRRSSAIVHSPSSVDISTPVYAEGIRWEATLESAKFDMRYNNRSIVYDCKTGDCDGIKYAYALDLDGSLVGAVNGTVLGPNPQAVALRPDGSAACREVVDWNGFLCTGATYRKAFLEGFDTGRVAMGNMQFSALPVAGDNRTWRTMQAYGSALDICALQVAQAMFAHVVQPGEDGQFFFPSTEPGQITYTYFNDAASEQGSVMRLQMQRASLWQVFVDGALARNLNLESTEAAPRYPARDDAAGAYLNSPREKYLYFTVRPGTRIYTLVRTPAVALTFDLGMTVEAFNGPAFLEALQLLLGIPAWRMSIVDVKAGSAVVDVHITDNSTTVFNNVSSSAADTNAPADASAQQAAADQIARLAAITAQVQQLAANGTLDSIGGVNVSNLNVTVPVPVFIVSSSPSVSPSASVSPSSTSSSSVTSTSSSSSTLSASISFSTSASATETPSQTQSSSLSASTTQSASGTPSVTATRTSSSSATASASSTPSITATASASASSTPSPTLTSSATASLSAIGSGSATQSLTASASYSQTTTTSPTQSPTNSPSATDTIAGTASGSVSTTDSASLSATATSTSSNSQTASSAASQSAAISASQTTSATGSSTASPTATLSSTAVETATVTASETASPAASSTASQTETSTTSPTGAGTTSPSSSAAATSTATPSSSPSLSAQATSSPASSASASASLTASSAATQSSSPTSSSSATTAASATASLTVSVAVSISASASPSATDSATPSSSPSASLSATATASGAATTSSSGSASAAESASASATGSATGAASVSPSASPSASSSASSSATASAVETATVTASETASPAASSTASQTETSTTSPTGAGTTSPSSSAAATSTATPSSSPSLSSQATSSPASSASTSASQTQSALASSSASPAVTSSLSVSASVSLAPSASSSLSPAASASATQSQVPVISGTSTASPSTLPPSWVVLTTTVSFVLPPGTPSSEACSDAVKLSVLQTVAGTAGSAATVNGSSVQCTTSGARRLAADAARIASAPRRLATAAEYIVSLKLASAAAAQAAASAVLALGTSSFGSTSIALAAATNGLASSFTAAAVGTTATCGSGSSTGCALPVLSAPADGGTSSSASSLSGGAIAGIVIGAAAFLAAVALATVLLIRHERRRQVEAISQILTGKAAARPAHHVAVRKAAAPAAPGDASGVEGVDAFSVANTMLPSRSSVSLAMPAAQKVGVRLESVKQSQPAAAAGAAALQARAMSDRRFYASALPQQSLEAAGQRSKAAAAAAVVVDDEYAGAPPAAASP